MCFKNLLVIITLLINSFNIFPAESDKAKKILVLQNLNKKFIEKKNKLLKNIELLQKKSKTDKNIKELIELQEQIFKIYWQLEKNIESLKQLGIATFSTDEEKAILSFSDIALKNEDFEVDEKEFEEFGNLLLANLIQNSSANDKISKKQKEVAANKVNNDKKNKTNKKKKKTKNSATNNNSSLDLIKKTEEAKNKEEKVSEEQTKKVEDKQKVQEENVDKLKIDSIQLDLFIKAVRSNDLMTVENLLKNNREYLNQKIIIDNTQVSALETAIVFGHNAMVKLLISYGASYNTQNPDYYNWTPLHVAVWHCKLDIVKTLLEIKDIDCNAYDAKGWTAFHLAASNAGTICNDSIQDLLNSGDQNDRNVAITFVNFRKIVELFVTMCPESDILTKSNINVIQLAVTYGNFGSVEYLLKFYDAHVKDRLNSTLLHFASYNNNVTLFRYLLTQDINVNAKTIDNNTCLHIAAEYNNYDVVEFIKNHNSKLLLIRNNKNLTALDIAKLEGNENIIKILSSN